MAITNAMIVLNESVKLMEEGIIGTTGRKIVVQDAEGNELELMEPETIHTYQTWKALGYQVKKGSKAIAKFAIWKYKPNNKSDDEAETNDIEIIKNGKMFMKEAAWFSMSQVERMA